jgi:hypothetical protein
VFLQLAQICARVDYVNSLQENLKGQDAASEKVRGAGLLLRKQTIEPRFAGQIWSLASQTQAAIMPSGLQCDDAI